MAATKRAPPLSQAEFLTVAIEYELLTRDERNFQHGPRAVMFGLGNTVNERIRYEHSRPYGREIVSLPHQFHTQFVKSRATRKMVLCESAFSTDLILRRPLPEAKGLEG